MATHATSLNPCGNSDALFTAWGLGIYNALIAVGKTRTADTGQVNWGSTQTKNTTTSSDQFAIYDVWNLGGTEGFVLRIEYGMGYYYGGNSLNNFCMRIYIGQGTDGAGNLTGTPSPAIYLTPANIAAGTTSYPCYFSGGAGRLSMSLYHSLTTAGLSSIFSIEKVKDSSGDDAEIGVSYYVFNNSGATDAAVAAQQYLKDTSTPVHPSTPIRPLNYLSSVALDGDVYGLKVGFSPSCPFLGNVLTPDLACVFFTNLGMLGQSGTIVPLTFYGQTHYYLLYGSDSSTANGASYNISGHSTLRQGIGIRYE